MVGGHDGEAVLGQVGAQQRVEVIDLRGVGQVLHVHPQAFLRGEVLLLEFCLAGLHAVDEGLLGVGEFQGVGGERGAIVVVAIRLLGLHLDGREVGRLGKLVHQRVVPRRG